DGDGPEAGADDGDLGHVRRPDVQLGYQQHPRRGHRRTHLHLDGPVLGREHMAYRTIVHGVAGILMALGAMVIALSGRPGRAVGGTYISHHKPVGTWTVKISLNGRPVDSDQFTLRSQP